MRFWGCLTTMKKLESIFPSLGVLFNQFVACEEHAICSPMPWDKIEFLISDGLRATEGLVKCLQEYDESEVVGFLWGELDLIEILKKGESNWRGCTICNDIELLEGRSGL